jgi:signal transduction histidine kinase
MEQNAMHERKLVIQTDAIGADVRLHVTDSGPGIPDADLGNIFDPFWSSKPGGMGMGLAICKSIVSAHGGSLTATNGDAGGATFCVCLPLHQSA